MRHLLIFLTSVLITGKAFGSDPTSQESPQPLHLTTRFNFDVDAPFAETALLFGPQSEKRWAGEHWQPRFFYPQPGQDTAGAVFTIFNGRHTSTWVNTVYNVTDGRMQYVAIIPQVVATVIDVKLARVSATRTRVEVTYTRTALDPAANGDVRDLARDDANSGPEWSQAIRASLGTPAR